MNKMTVGRWGEQQAADTYIRRGYTLMERNYRKRPVEIDLILSNGEFLVFCEVKTRKGTRFGRAVEAVDERKMEHLREGAAWYLAEHNTETLQPRFDVAEVYYDLTANGPRLREINVIENAFGG